jgi:hypothetical protein
MSEIYNLFSLLRDRIQERGIIVRLASKLSGLELCDWRGEQQRLGTFWQDRAVVLVFIRHFG